MKIAVLNNLRAGKSDSRVDQVLAFLRRHPDILHIETKGDPVVPEALARLCDEDVDVLVLNGGDGTIQLTLTHLLEVGNPGWRPLIAPIRGGRTNMTAIDLGTSRSPVKSLARLLEACRNDRIQERTVTRRVLRVDLSDRSTRYGMFLGAGALHRAVDYTHNAFPPGRSQGVFGAGIVTGVLLARAAIGSMAGILAPDKIRISRDGVLDPPSETLLALATTLERLFLRMRPYWGREDGPVHLTTIASGAPGLWRSAPGILAGRPPARATPEAGYRSTNVRECQLQLDAGLVLDGELFDPEPDRSVRLTADEEVRFVRV
jgi:hypothetical protein